MIDVRPGLLELDEEEVVLDPNSQLGGESIAHEEDHVVGVAVSALLVYGMDCTPYSWEGG